MVHLSYECYSKVRFDLGRLISNPRRVQLSGVAQRRNKMQISPVPFILAFAFGGIAWLIGGWDAVLYTEIVWALVVAVLTTIELNSRK